MTRLYLAECPERAMLKIGRTTQDCESRIRNLAKTVPGEWRLVGAFEGRGAVEPAIHRQLSDLRHPEVQGREWYRDTAAVRAAFFAAKREQLHLLRDRAIAARYRLNVAQDELRSARAALKRANGG